MRTAEIQAWAKNATFSFEDTIEVYLRTEALYGQDSKGRDVYGPETRATATRTTSALLPNGLPLSLSFDAAVSWRGTPDVCERETVAVAFSPVEHGPKDASLNISLETDEGDDLDFVEAARLVGLALQEAGVPLFPEIPPLLPKD